MRRLPKFDGAAAFGLVALGAGAILAIRGVMALLGCGT